MIRGYRIWSEKFPPVVGRSHLGINIGGMTPILPGLLLVHFGKKYFGVIYGVSFFMLSLVAMIVVYFTRVPPKTLK